MTVVVDASEGEIAGDGPSCGKFRVTRILRFGVIRFTTYRFGTCLCIKSESHPTRMIGLRKIGIGIIDNGIAPLWVGYAVNDEEFSVFARELWHFQSCSIRASLCIQWQRRIRRRIVGRRLRIRLWIGLRIRLRRGLGLWSRKRGWCAISPKDMRVIFSFASRESEAKRAEK